MVGNSILCPFPDMDFELTVLFGLLSFPLGTITGSERAQLKLQ